jgi:hypothetical protein
MIATRRGATARWPKLFSPLTAEQQRISDDFMKHWHELLPQRFGLIECFIHGYPVGHAPAPFRRTLEIGAGLGEHLHYEKLTPTQEENYFAVELRENMSRQISERFSRVPVGPAMTLDPKMWSAAVRVNLDGTFNVLRAFAGSQRAWHCRPRRRLYGKGSGRCHPYSDGERKQHHAAFGSIPGRGVAPFCQPSETEGCADEMGEHEIKRRR